jgi:hypothetical protein
MMIIIILIPMIMMMIVIITMMMVMMMMMIRVLGWTPLGAPNVVPREREPLTRPSRTG